MTFPRFWQRFSYLKVTSIQSFLYLMLIFVCSAVFPPLLSASEPPVVKEIRYHIPEAGEVFLVWGIDGWNLVSEEIRPTGTVVKDKVMHSPMGLEDDVFVIKVQVPPGVTIDYGFLITKKRDGTTIPAVWDGNKNYYTTAVADESVEIRPPRTLIQVLEDSNSDDAPFLTKEIHYYLPDAGEVFFVWGVNGWNVVPPEMLPDGTVIKNNVMHTPMHLQDDIFITRVKVPAGVVIDYGFLITQSRDGSPQELWDGAEEYKILANDNDRVEIHAALASKRTIVLPILLKAGLLLFFGISAFIGIGIILMHFSLRADRRVVVLALVALILLGFTLRLWLAGTTDRLLNTPADLIGDEPRYDHLAVALLRGEFFQWPGATPVYPIFLAAIYRIFNHSYAAVLFTQAMVGAVAIPLTYQLARHFTNERSSLLAASMVALLPALISQVGYLYTEVIYTTLLLLTILSLVWALESKSIYRFILAGLLVGITTLTRPATVLLPFLLPLMLPRTWSLRRKVAVWLVYGFTMAAIVLPWTYHNYRTHKTIIPFSLSLTMLWHGSPEFYHLMRQKENAILTVWEEELNPARNGGHDPLTIEGDRYFNARAIASIQAEPTVYIWYSFQKIAYFWIGHPASNPDWPFDLKLLPYFSAGYVAGIFGVRLLLIALALLALFILRHRLGAIRPLLILCSNLMLIYAILAPVARYSEPLYPILAVIIAIAISEILGRHYWPHLQPVPAMRPKPVKIKWGES